MVPMPSSMPISLVAIVGHRGVGKSTFLKSLAGADFGMARVFTYDLDEIIEKGEQRSIGEMFSKNGETYFRDLEKKYLQTLVECIESDFCRSSKDFSEHHFIAIGAGYAGTFEHFDEVLWLKRKTDKCGRIFLNRPRLDASRGPLEEYMSRVEGREKKYSDSATEVLTLIEGQNVQEFLAPWMGFSDVDMGGVVTILPENLKAELDQDGEFARWIQKRLDWNVELFEVRDDLVTETQWKRLKNFIPENRLLLSLRRSDSFLIKELSATKDWALELGANEGFADITSLHERHRNESIDQAADRLEAMGASSRILKLAVMVENIDELQAGHRWAQRNPKKNVFLPRSEDGRWSWYRLIRFNEMSLGFWREGDGSAFDQPTWMEVAANKSFSRFAAILGDPVVHSRSPGFHSDFFAKRGIGFLRIQADSLTLPDLKFYRELGIEAFAVTSPLKEMAFSLLDIKNIDESAQRLKAVNTLVWSGSEWKGFNTDVIGLTSVIGGVEGPSVLWGGGGTVSSVLEVLPKIHHYSARTGASANPWIEQNGSQDLTLIWAVGRSQMKNCIYPPSHWRIGKIIDLNYSEDSPGLELSQARGIPYESGLRMFESQGMAQRKIWSKYFPVTASVEQDLDSNSFRAEL